MSGQNFGPNPGRGEYYPVAIANGVGQLFSGGNQAAVAAAFTAGLTTTYTGGLILFNPTASTANLIIQRVTAAFDVAQTNPAAIGIGVGLGSSITTPGTAIASQNALVSSNASIAVAQGVLYSPTSATLPAAPYLARLIGHVASGAETTELDSSQMTLDLQGSLILTPGSFACFVSSAAGTASSFLGSFTWVELAAGATA